MAQGDPGSAPSPLPPSDADPRQADRETTHVQGNLFAYESSTLDSSQLSGLKFDGPGLEPEDHPPLGRQLQAVLSLLSDGRPRTAQEIAAAIGCGDAAATARVRDLRKRRFGGHVVERQRIGPRVHVYRLIPAR